MESEDGQLFIKNLASFVRTHERALAAALQLQHKRNGNPKATATASSTTITLAEALSRPYLSFSSQTIKSAKLPLTPHHLFYLLSKFEDLGVEVGPTTVRLENLQSTATPSNYVSFLGHAPKSKGKQADAESLRSVSSVRSAMSSMSSLWSTFSLSNSVAKEEKKMAQHHDDVKYLYSSFTKIPGLKLGPDHRARLIRGFEEFPFDTAVPLFVFKNLTVLEISDLDFRQFHGWDRLSEQLKSLSVRRACLDDPTDLLRNIVLDDMEKRRKRSSMLQNIPTTPLASGTAWPGSSPKFRQGELARSFSSPNSLSLDQRRASVASPLTRTGSSEGSTKTPGRASRQRSTSPVRPQSSRHGSVRKARQITSQVYRRSSGSSGSSITDVEHRHSPSDLLAFNILPSSKWRMLTSLSIPENGLTSLSVESLRPIAGTLRSLDLSSNLFKEIPDALASLTNLLALNMSNCMIDSLQSLARYPLPAITVLNLRSNRLLSLAGIEKIRTLERLDLRENKLYDPTEIRRLTNALDLSDVYVERNTFTRSYSDYRVTIFNAFRDAPGHTADLAIDTLGPTSHEKKLLHDRAPEPAPVAVVQPPLEDEQEVAADAPALRLQTPAPEQHWTTDFPRSHRRTTSDFGPQSQPRKRRVPRRRIVELSQAESLSSSSTIQVPAAVPENAPISPTDIAELATPQKVVYHNAPATEVGYEEALLTSERPSSDTAYASPTPPTKVISDDSDDSSLKSPEAVDSHSDLYRQKIEGLKNELGPNWLTALNEDRFLEHGRVRNRSYSPGSRTPSRTGPTDRGISVGGRKLG
ncbi:hypothetical protein LTR62_005319 [Meristemomyces frigidus]|uniref:Leucine rich repeat domain-containing protein n=1 Tax=Meristemomyces frigidus TaxID=1508187 RepID=A0AAN7YFG2_9PEZI|nr:hypothetical protein LTR62_005319 [Meristemomyces frigidus]